MIFWSEKEHFDFYSVRIPECRPMNKNGRFAMDNIFPWCLNSPYAFDMYRNMLRKEREHSRRGTTFTALHRRVVQEGIRKKLVDWVKTIAHKYRFSNVTLHLGVFLLDKILSYHFSLSPKGWNIHSISLSRLIAISIICLIVAAKFEEEAVDVPKISEVASVINTSVPHMELLRMERFIFQISQWDVFWPTVAHFAEFYSVFAVVKGDRDPSRRSSKNLTDIVRGTLKEFVDMSLNDSRMLRYLPSQVAASSLMAARLSEGVRPIWPGVISKLTGYSADSLQSSLNLLIEMDIACTPRRKRKAEDLNESGYESSSPENYMYFKMPKRL